IARTVAAEPIRSTLALPTCAATNSPHDAPVKASPLRSRTCAHRLMLERLSHPLVRLIIWLPSWNWGAAAEYQARHAVGSYAAPQLRGAPPASRSAFPARATLNRVRVGQAPARRKGKVARECR